MGRSEKSGGRERVFHETHGEINNAYSFSSRMTLNHLQIVNALQLSQRVLPIAAIVPMGGCGCVI
jgi:hypothetical protein